MSDVSEVTIVKVILMSLITLWILLSNAFLLIAVLSDKKVRQKSCLIVNLAVFPFFAILLCVAVPPATCQVQCDQCAVLQAPKKGELSLLVDEEIFGVNYACVVLQTCSPGSKAWYELASGIKFPSPATLHACLGQKSLFKLVPNINPDKNGYWPKYKKCKGFSCFPGDARVEVRQVRHGKDLRDVMVGDEVLAVDEDGNLVWSPVLAFLDRDDEVWARYAVIGTDFGHRLELSGKHLVKVVRNYGGEMRAVEEGHMHSSGEFVFADDVKVGDRVFVRARGGKIVTGTVLQMVRRVSRAGEEMVRKRSKYAPLTAHGTLLVDGVVSSCFAHFGSHHAAQWLTAPLKLLKQLTGQHLVTMLAGAVQPLQSKAVPNGVHWFAAALHAASKLLLFASPQNHNYIIPDQCSD